MGRKCAYCGEDLPAASAFCTNCGATAAPGRASGPVLAGYTILRTLGQGGAAVVYLAEQESLGRQVAVKVLRRDVEEPKVWRQFRREARTIASLSGHPNVVTVYTAGRSHAGQPYLVTEFLDRGSLGDVIAAEGPLPPTFVAEVGIAIADALAAAHGLGILHRDVKPGNVMLGHDGRVKLGDFGIARLLAGQSATTTDVFAFTPEYVAPEVLRGEPDGPFSDIYGLASTLAAALTGAPLFARGPDERVDVVLSRKLLGPPPPLPASVPGVLAGLITQSLDPDPTRRPSLHEFRERLASAAEVLGAEVPQPPPTWAAVPVARTTVARAPSAGAQRHPVPTAPLLGPLRRDRRRLAMPVFFLATIVAALAGVFLLGDGGEGGNASNTTSLIVLTPTSGASAQPTSTSDAGAPAATAAPVTVTTTIAVPVVAPVPTTTTDAATPSTELVTPPPTLPAPADTAPAPPAPTSPPATAANAMTPDVTTAEEAEAFVRSYYDIVEAGDYETSWAKLAPEFQRDKARSYDYYVRFWNDNDIRVGKVHLVAADEENVIVNVELRWNGSSSAVTDQFTLRPGAGSGLLIARQTTVRT
jgi:eukaryotic-like serine/threonine-protein kinase